MSVYIDNENALREWVKELLGLTELHRVEAAPGTTPGFPDLLLPVELGGVHLAVLLPCELKVWDDGVAKVRPAQRAFHRRMANAGVATCLLVAIRAKGALVGVAYLHGRDVPLRDAAKPVLRPVWLAQEGEPNDVNRQRLLKLLRSTYQ